MAFEGLTEKLQGALRKLSSKGKLTEDNVKEGMREVRMALLEADVNYAVAKDFIKKVTARCVGTEITGTLSASQQVIKIVNEEMTQLMGGTNAKLTWSSSVPTIYMLCGLQGAGKTTMAAKLANYLQKTGKKPLLAACNIVIPALHHILHGRPVIGFDGHVHSDLRKNRRDQLRLRLLLRVVLLNQILYADSLISQNLFCKRFCLLWVVFHREVLIERRAVV
mgnify:CR=1 FL=1